MIPRLRDHAAVLAFVVASLLGSGRPSFALESEPPGRTESAASHFRHGVTLYKDGDYEGALVEFRRAQELTPNYRVLYDIGQSLYQLQRYAEALKAFEDYLAQGGAQLSAARRASVEADLRALRARVGYVAVVVNVDGAEVRVDDQVVGTSPLSAPVLVSIGHRKITVAARDRVPIERFVDIAVGDRAKVVFEVPVSVATGPAPPPPSKDRESAESARTAARSTPEASATPPSPTPPQPSEPSQGAPLGWVPWATTGLLAIGTGVTGALALTSKASLSNDLATFPGDASAIEQDRRRANTFSVASDILLGASAVSLIVAVYVTLRPHRARTGEAAGAVRVRLGLDGVRLQGDF